MYKDTFVITPVFKNYTIKRKTCITQTSNYHMWIYWLLATSRVHVSMYTYGNTFYIFLSFYFIFFICLFFEQIIMRYLVYFGSVNPRYLNSHAPVPVVYPAVSQCSRSQISAVHCSLFTTLHHTWHWPTHLPLSWMLEPLWLCISLIHPSIPHFVSLLSLSPS